MHIKKLFGIFLILPLLLTGCGGGRAPEEKREMHDYSIYDKGVNFLDEYWQAPEFRYDSSEDVSNSQALWIRNDYNGEESYNFAFLAKPSVKKDKYPGVVLVHGGGGTAYYEWAEEWARRGYIALAIDLEGHVPNKDANITTNPLYDSLYHASPYKAPTNVNLGDYKLPENETWLHYACRSVIIGNSFLHHLEEIDIYNIGVCGVGWGGYITSIVTGYDDRFAFAISIYCTKEMKEAGTPMSEYLKNAKGAFDKFDNFEALSLVNTPFNIIVGDDDVWGDVHAFTSMVSVMKNATMTVKHRFDHSNLDALYAQEPYKFADTILNKKTMPVFVRDGNEVVISNMPDNVSDSFLLITNGTDIKKLKTFDRERRKLTNNKITLDVGEDVTYFVVCIEDSNGCVFTSALFRNNAI